MATFTIVPRHVLGGSGHIPPSERLNIAGIGVGGIAGQYCHSCGQEADLGWAKYEGYQRA